MSEIVARQEDEEVSVPCEGNHPGAERPRRQLLCGRRNMNASLSYAYTALGYYEYVSQAKDNGRGRQVKDYTAVPADCNDLMSTCGDSVIVDCLRHARVKS